MNLAKKEQFLEAIKGQGIDYLNFKLRLEEVQTITDLITKQVKKLEQRFGKDIDADLINELLSMDSYYGCLLEDLKQGKMI